MRAITVIAAALVLAKYHDIQSALTAAKATDVINVAAGLYELPNGIGIAKVGVTLQGAGADRTILDGKNNTEDVVSILVPGVTVTGFTLRNGAGTGVSIKDSTNLCNINHNVIIGMPYPGVSIGSGSLFTVIDHNTFAKNDQFAVNAEDDDPGTEITNNIFYMNGDESPVFRSIISGGILGHVTSVKYNCFFGQPNDSATAGTSSTNLRTDPMLVDPPNDFHLEDGSPCLGAASDGTDFGALGKGKNPTDEKPATKGAGGK